MTAALGETTEDSFRLAIYEYSVAIADETEGLCTAKRLKGCFDELIRHYRALSERLATVEAETREECAKVCEQIAAVKCEHPDVTTFSDRRWTLIDEADGAKECAAAIRAGK